MCERMKFRSLETTTSVTTSTVAAKTTSVSSLLDSRRSSSSTSSSSRVSFRSSSDVFVSTEAGIRTNEMTMFMSPVSSGSGSSTPTRRLGIEGTATTTKVEVLSDGLKWLVIYSLLPSSSAGAAMSGRLRFDWFILILIELHSYKNLTRAHTNI